MYRWFDALDLNELDTVQRVFPGKELLRKALEVLNSWSEKPITRGNLVASLRHEYVPADIIDFLKSAAEPTAKKK